MNYMSNPNLKNTSYTPPQGRLPTEAELVGVRTKLPAGNPWRDTDLGYIFSQEEMDDIFPSKKSKVSLASYPSNGNISNMSSTLKTPKPISKTNNSWEYDPFWNDLAQNVNKATKQLDSVGDMLTIGTWSNAKADAQKAGDDIHDNGLNMKTGTHLADAVMGGSAQVVTGALVTGESIGGMTKGINTLNKGLNKPTTNKSDEVKKLMKEYLGENAKVIKNQSNDTIFIDPANTKKIRFDMNNPSPHNNPHAHIEEFINGQLKKSDPIYPKDVPHN